MTFRKLIIICISLSFVFSPFVSAAPTMDRIEEIENQIKDLDERMNHIETENEKDTEYLERLKQFRDRTKQYLDSIDDTIVYAQDRADVLKEQMEAIQARIWKAEDELREVEERLTKKQDILASRLRMIYMMDRTAYIDVLLSAKSISDFFIRLGYLNFIIQNDRHVIDSVKADKELVEQKKKEIEKELHEYEKKLRLMERMSILLEEEKIYKREDLEEARTQITIIERITKEQERELMELAERQKELFELKERLQLAYKGGVMLYPLEGSQYPLTSGFGKRTDPVTGEPDVMHRGIDIGAPKGTNILAAADGVVLVAGWYGGYGNCVVIDHGNGIWTVYGHMLDDSVKVTVGQRVSTGEVIGQVGTTGKSTGYHLHFEVRLNQEAVDPMPYLGLE